METPGGVSTSFDKADKFCDFPLAFLYKNTLLKRGILKILPREVIPFRVDLLPEERSTLKCSTLKGNNLFKANYFLLK